MVDSCRQLTVSQNNGDEDTAGMVTILTGHQVEELCTRSAAMKVGRSLYFVTLLIPTNTQGVHIYHQTWQSLMDFGFLSVSAGVLSSLDRVRHCSVPVKDQVLSWFIVLQEILVLHES